MNGVKKGLYLLLFSLCFVPSYAQLYELPETPSEFIDEVQSILKKQKSDESNAMGEIIAPSFNSLTEGQKEKVIKISRAMMHKRYRVVPHFTNFMGVVHYAKKSGFPSAEIDTLLDVADYVIENFQPNRAQDFMRYSRKLFEKGVLYESPTHSINVTGGSFTFELKTAKEEVTEIDMIDKLIEDKEEVEEIPEDDGGYEDDWGSFDDWDTDSDDDWGTYDDFGGGDGYTDKESTDVEKDMEEKVLMFGAAAEPQPPVDGPVIEFKNVSFVFKTTYDSTALQNTSGNFMFKNDIYVADTGRMDWSSAGLAPSEVYVDLGPFNFDITKLNLSAENVKLSYPSRTDEPVNGMFEFQSVRHKGPEDATYPRFMSYSSNIPIKGMGPDIEYNGGFSMEGHRINSASVTEGRSTIIVSNGGEKKLKAVGRRFIFDDSLITSDPSRITIYRSAEDSIMHPGVRLTYDKNKRFLSLFDSKGGFKESNFLDSYHGIEFNVDALKWDLNTPEMKLSIINARGQVPAVYESKNYFNKYRYMRLKGLYKFHPLQMAVGYIELENKRRGPGNEIDGFYVSDLAKKYKLNENTVHGAMTALMQKGYIDYSPKTRYVKIREKGYHYVAAARNKIDYDNIRFESNSPSGFSGTININTHELTVNGVKRVYLSDSLEVFIQPDSSQIHIQENRNFKFNGKIHTANFIFIGEECQFEYDSFYIVLPNIDSIQFKLATKNEESGEEEDRMLSNELRYSSGILYINKPNNKSSRKRFPDYPKFEANTGAKVMFNKEHIMGGAYDSTMYFEIPPFDVDSLSANNPAAISFDGKFSSGGIFPDFEEKLIIMEDMSLGFKHPAPPEGYPMYGDKGRFYNTLKMDNQGLRGDGEIHYLTTVARSPDFAFFKDSVITIGTSAETQEGPHAEANEGVTFADMTVEEYEMNWQIKTDSMKLTNLSAPFRLYRNTATLIGSVIISKTGMYGSGVLNTRGSESASTKFHFQETEYAGREATFRILSDNPSKPALKANHVKLDFQLEDGIATFSPEVEGFASNEFPYMQYKSSLDKGVWDLNQRKITMSMPEDGDLSKSYFYSTKEDQDSLVYNAAGAVYDMDKQTLNIHGIPYIISQDAKIYPDSGKVFIEENAKMQELNNTRIVMDTLNEYHSFTDGRIQIFGRNNFDGEANYQYGYRPGDTLLIQFSKFEWLPKSDKKNAEFQTVSKAPIGAKDTFLLASKIAYAGEVTLRSDQKILDFIGGVRLFTQGPLQSKELLAYENTEGDEDIMIPFKNEPSKGNDEEVEEKTPLYAGIYYDRRKLKLTSLLANKKDEMIRPVLPTDGFIYFNPATEELVVGNKERINKNTQEGNLFIYDDNSSLISYGGKFQFIRPNPDFESTIVGTGFANLADEDYNFNTLAIFDFDIPSQAYDYMGEQIVSGLDSTFKGFAHQRDSSLLFKLAQILGDKDVEKIKANTLAGTELKLAEQSGKLSNGIVFSNVDFKWSDKKKAWYSMGKLGLSNIGKTNINKKLNGYIEIKNTGGETEAVYIYIELSKNKWFFIGYNMKKLAAGSSIQEFNDIIDDKSKGDPGDPTKYFFISATGLDKNAFVRHFEGDFLGLGGDDYVPEPEPVVEDTMPSDSLPADSIDTPDVTPIDGDESETPIEEGEDGDATPADEGIKEDE